MFKKTLWGDGTQNIKLASPGFENKRFQKIQYLIRGKIPLSKIHLQIDGLQVSK